MLQRGAFLISIDTEMAWGSVHHRDVGRHYSYQAEREFIDRLLALFDKYQIRATWAVVGHLFLDQCQAVDGRKHPEIVRPGYRWSRVTGSTPTLAPALGKTPSGTERT